MSERPQWSADDAKSGWRNGWGYVETWDPDEGKWRSQLLWDLAEDPHNPDWEKLAERVNTWLDENWNPPPRPTGRTGFASSWVQAAGGNAGGYSDRGTGIPSHTVDWR